eukprot:2692733-Prymnesium_polylepis.1
MSAFLNARNRLYLGRANFQAPRPLHVYELVRSAAARAASEPRQMSRFIDGEAEMSDEEGYGYGYGEDDEDGEYEEGFEDDGFIVGDDEVERGG